MNADGGGNGIGQPVQRKEDLRLLTGQGSYGDDLILDGMVFAAMVRSPHAHARLRSIDTTRARGVPGVVVVLSGADLLADGIKPIPHNPTLVGPPDVVLSLRPGFDTFISTHHAMPTDKARFVGETVAMVIATSNTAALDGAEEVEIDYEQLPSVTNAMDATKPEAPKLWANSPTGNVCVDVEVGDEAATNAIFAKAAHVVRFDTAIQRVTGVPMEPRTSTAAYDAATGQVTLYAGTGSGVAKLKVDLAAILGLPPEKVRALVRDMGGNFGTRNFFFPEFALLGWAARRVGRPVKWICTRSEAFLADYQGRDLTVTAELALDKEGNFLAVRGSNLSNVGAHTVAFVSLRKGLGLMSSVYRMKSGYFRGRCVTTNTVPTTPYRSAGRPEAIYVMERLVDLAARQCGFDPVALRRRNLIPPAAQPFTNPFGLTYDSGTYEAAMDRSLKLADHADFAARRADSKRRGRCRGIGVSNYIEITSGAPRERTEITVLPQGKVEMVVGTAATGQGHETSFAQLVTEWLGVPFESVELVHGDTERVKAGGGSHSGRSMKMVTIVAGIATDAIIEKGRRIAGHLLETGEPDIEFVAGRFTVKGTDRSLGIFDVAKSAVTRTDLPADLQGPLQGIGDETVPVGSFPYGTQVCEVEVDPDTGAVDILRFSAVDDVGRAVNPLILHGQTHGGIAQGVGQALLEDCAYDRKTGQMLGASFMDYAMPRADTFPSFATALSEVPAPTNRLGVRSGGEGGTTPALAVVINAIVDALAEFGVTHVEMPATPERVWRAIQAARSKGAAD
jgi:aerobic carbon-monoxide dehydrogenase large subunit